MSFATAAQQMIADELSARPFFSDNGIVVLSEYLKDLENQIDIALAKVDGKCIIIFSPELDSDWSNSAGAFFNKISFIAAVYQNPILAGDIVPDDALQGIDIAVEVSLAVYQLQIDILNGPLVMVSPGIKKIPEDNNVVHYVFFQGQGGDRAEPDQVAPVVITNNSGTITLTCATEGAGIFYRTDGKPPATAGASTHYTAPFAASSGTKILARAWLAGLVASPIATLQT